MVDPATAAAALQAVGGVGEAAAGGTRQSSAFARGDSYQGGVSLSNSFGDFNVVGGGAAAGVGLETPRASFLRSAGMGNSQVAGMPTGQFLIIALIIGGAAWYFLKK